MKRYAPAVILGIGAILRILGTGASALWFDEANMLYRTTIPFMQLFSEHSERSGDLLLEIILRPLMAISHSVWMLRLPSMVAGVVSLWLVWKLMDRLNFNLRQQVITSTLIAFLPGLLWLAQDARSYGLLSLLFLAALWFTLESQWLGLLACCGLMIYTHSTGPLYAIASLMLALYLYPWKIKKIVLVGLLVAVAWIPAVVRMLGYWIIQQPWQPHLTLSWFVQSVIQGLWPEPIIGATVLFPMVMLLLTGALLFSTFIARARIITVAAWGLPLFGMTLFCIVLEQNVVQYRTLMPMLFPFALWLGWELGIDRLYSWVMTGAWACLLIFGLVLWSPSYRGGHLDTLASEIRSRWRTGDQLIYTTVTVGLPFDYYLSDLPHHWDGTVRDPYFLRVPSILRSDLAPTGEVAREWVVIPRETTLITPDEQAALRTMVHNQEPIYTIVYLQAAPIDVYLVEMP